MNPNNEIFRRIKKRGRKILITAGLAIGLACSELLCRYVFLPHMTKQIFEKAIEESGVMMPNETKASDPNLIFEEGGERVDYVLSHPEIRYNLLVKDDLEILPMGKGKIALWPGTKPSRTDKSLSRQKKKGEIRIPILGESAVHGIAPIRFNETISANLQDILNAKYSKLEIYCINEGVTAVDSCTLATIVEKSFAYQPDLFVFYIGNNEFGCSSFSRRYVSETALGKKEVDLSEIWTRLDYNTESIGLASLMFIKQAFRDIRISWKYRELKGKSFSKRVGELLIVNKDGFYEEVEEHTKRNLIEMIDDTRKMKVPVLLCTIGSRQRDCSPGGLENGINKQAHKLYAQAEEKYSKGNYEEAKKLYKEARFRDKAKCGRGTPLINDVIIRVAASENVPIADIEKALEDGSPHGIIGKELFFDVYHPNAEGCRVIAQALARIITENKLIEREFERKEE